MARANDAARVEGTDSAPTSMPLAVRMAIEKAKEPPPSAFNAKQEPKDPGAGDQFGQHSTNACVKGGPLC